MPTPQPQRPLSDRGETDEIGNLNDKKTWLSGILLMGSYSNFHHDPFPTCIVLYSDRKYTHIINVNYLSGNQRRQFKAGLRMWVFIDPRLKYNWLRLFNKSCLIGYRTLFTGLFHPISAWVIDELKDSIPQAEALLGKINGIKPTDWGKFKARAVQAATARDVAVMQRTQAGRPNQQRPSVRPNARPLSIRVTEAIRRVESRVNSGSVRPGPLRPKSQRPGS